MRISFIVHNYTILWVFFFVSTVGLCVISHALLMVCFDFFSKEPFQYLKSEKNLRDLFFQQK